MIKGVEIIDSFSSVSDRIWTWKKYYYIAESARGQATWVRPFQDFFRLHRKKKILFPAK